MLNRLVVSSKRPEQGDWIDYAPDPTGQGVGMVDQLHAEAGGGTDQSSEHGRQDMSSQCKQAAPDHQGSRWEVRQGGPVA